MELIVLLKALYGNVMKSIPADLRVGILYINLQPV